MTRQAARVFDFEPDLRQKRAVADLDDLLGFLADLRAERPAVNRRLDIVRIPPDEQPPKRQEQRQEVSDAEEEFEAGAKRDGERDDRNQDHQGQRPPLGAEHPAQGFAHARDPFRPGRERRGRARAAGSGR